MRTFENYLNEGWSKNILTLAATGLALSQAPKAYSSIVPHSLISKTETQSSNYITSDLLNLVKHFEGFYPNAYKDPAGVLTIGYGFTKYDIPSLNEKSTITQAEADILLSNILLKYMSYVDKYVKVPLKRNQKDALTSFIYNVGPSNFKNSTLLKKLNNKDYKGAGNEFLRWNRVGKKKLKGLTRRRIAEKLLFEK